MDTTHLEAARDNWRALVIQAHDLAGRALSAGQVQWRSRAADRYRESVGNRLERLHRLAAAASEVAAAYDAHIAAVAAAGPLTVMASGLPGPGVPGGFGGPEEPGGFGV